MGYECGNIMTDVIAMLNNKEKMKKFDIEWEPI